jgi:hypothetical protein
MGAGCFKRRAYKAYREHLLAGNPGELKQRWAPIKLFKLKKLFDSNCLLEQEPYLTLPTFISLFPEFSERAHSYRDVPLPLKRPTAAAFSTSSTPRAPAG